jgi:single-strand DNA-binding protein
MNSINLVGRLTRDPELRETKGDTKVAGMRLAIPPRPKYGEQQAPVYVDVTSFGVLAQNCAEYLAKGRRIAVSGRLEYSEWTDRDGGKHSKHEVIADQVNFLDAPQNGTAEADDDEAGSE